MEKENRECKMFYIEGSVSDKEIMRDKLKSLGYKLSGFLIEDKPISQYNDVSYSFSWEKYRDLLAAKLTPIDTDPRYVKFMLPEQFEEAIAFAEEQMSLFLDEPLFINTIRERFFDKDDIAYWFYKDTLETRQARLAVFFYDDNMEEDDDSSQIYKTEASRDKVLGEYKESLKVNKGNTPKDIIDYIEHDAEIAIPIDDLFNDNGEVITRKEYGKVILKYLVKELREKFDK